MINPGAVKSDQIGHMSTERQEMAVPSRKGSERAAMVTLAFVGDVMLGRLVNDTIGKRKSAAFWGTTLPVLQQADAVIGNLEFAITRHIKEWRQTSKAFHFRADPGAVDILKAGHFTCVSLANNHMLDFEADGLRDTIDNLDQAGIKHAGAGETASQARAPCLFDVAGRRIAVISLTDNEPAFAAGGDRPGVNYVDLGKKKASETILLQAVDEAKAADADLIVLSAHLGPNMVERPSRRIRDFSLLAADLGVHIFHGHSAHVFQGVELRTGRVILHDTGDFIDDYMVDPAMHNDWSFLYLVDCDFLGPFRVRMLAVQLSLAQVDLAGPTDASSIHDRMVRLCDDFGTPVHTTRRGLCVPIRSPLCTPAGQD